jgi:hypothetical protein
VDRANLTVYIEEGGLRQDKTGITKFTGRRRSAYVMRRSLTRALTATSFAVQEEPDAVRVAHFPREPSRKGLDSSARWKTWNVFEELSDRA